MTGAEPAVIAAVAPEVIGATAAAAAPAAATLGATGAGLMGAGMGGGTAAMFGTAASPMATSLLAPAAATPMFTEAAALGAGMGGGMGGGTAALFGTGASALPGMAPMSLGAPAPVTGMDRFGAFMDKAQPILKGLDQAMGKQQQQPMPVPAQRPAQTAQPMSSADILAKLQKGGGGRSNFAGLLGNFGRY